MTISQLTISDIELLSVTHTRLIAEGFIPHFIDFGDFLDCVLGRGDYKVSTDNIIKEGL